MNFYWKNFPYKRRIRFFLISRINILRRIAVEKSKVFNFFLYVNPEDIINTSLQTFPFQGKFHYPLMYGFLLRNLFLNMNIEVVFIPISLKDNILRYHISRRFSVKSTILSITVNYPQKQSC